MGFPEPLRGSGESTKTKSAAGHLDITLLKKKALRSPIVGKIQLDSDASDGRQWVSASEATRH